MKKLKYEGQDGVQWSVPKRDGPFIDVQWSIRRVMASLKSIDVQWK